MSVFIAPGRGEAYATVNFAGGTGEESDPYQIAKADQLNEVRNYLSVIDNDTVIVTSYYTVDGVQQTGNLILKTL